MGTRAHAYGVRDVVEWLLSHSEVRLAAILSQTLSPK
jgi:hypothetical protein